MAKCRLVAKDWKNFMDHRTSLWGLVSTGKYMKAVEEGRLDMCRLIVQKAESKNPHQKIIIGWEYSGRKRKAARLFLTPLHIAADKGHYDICRLLVKNNQNKHPRDHLGRTPLHNAARKGHLEICRFILDNVPANYQLPFDRNGVSPLDLAQAYQHTELLLGLEYKSRVFSRKLRPGELLHGHNSVNSQQILMGLQGTLPISLDRVYPKYQND